MPKNKDLKRLARSRMKKTGESYTAARAELIKKSTQDFAERAGTSDLVVSAKTGRTWEEWVRLLDARGARSMIHRDIAAYLYEEQGVPGWWAQTVTVGYERIRGLRDVGQRRSGEYEASKSKTLPVPLRKLFRAFTVARTREVWLPGVKWTVRSTVPDKSIRVTWDDGTAVELYFVPKGREKTQVAVQHRKLRNKAQATKAKAYWGERLDGLARLMRSE
jgi:Activator of Hsp90 ATPase homolog 1-like protein